MQNHSLIISITNMKNLLLFLAVATAPAVTYAGENTTQPEVIPDFYALKMSNDGKIFISETDGETMAVYNRETNDYKEYSLCSRGLGNAISDNGIIVGSTLEDKPVIIIDGKLTSPAKLSNYILCNLHGITPDGTRICGLISNPKSGGSDDEENLMYLPMYVELNDGEVSEPVILPHPDKDFVNLTPQSCSATWISDDGRTIMGQVLDNSGMMPYPIVYRQASDGTWSYVLPTADLLNPEHLTLPPYPVEPVQPEPTDYMDEEEKAEYNADMAEWEASGYDPNLYPEPMDYMSEEKRKEYLADVREFETAAEIFNEKIEEYFDIRDRIMTASVVFEQNAFTMNAEGTLASSTSAALIPGDFQPIQTYAVYVIDLTTNSFRSIDTGTTEVIPGQIVDGEVVVLSSNSQSDYVPRGYLLKKGSDELLPIQDYLGGFNSDYKTWMTDNLSFSAYVEENGEEVKMDFIVTGRIALSKDMSVVAGAVPSYLFEDAEYAYMTYVFDDLTVGIDKVTSERGGKVRMMSDGTVKIEGEVSELGIMDMNGRTLLKLDAASGVIATDLHPGIYIVSYTADGEHRAAKVTISK